MSMQDTVADMLTRIRNAQMAQKASVTMPSSAAGPSPPFWLALMLSASAMSPALPRQTRTSMSCSAPSPLSPPSWLPRLAST